MQDKRVHVDQHPEQNVNAGTTCCRYVKLVDNDKSLVTYFWTEHKFLKWYY